MVKINCGSRGDISSPRNRLCNVIGVFAGSLDDNLTRLVMVWVDCLSSGECSGPRNRFCTVIGMPPGSLDDYGARALAIRRNGDWSVRDGHPSLQI